MYRLLEEGEMVEGGDEYYDGTENVCRWISVSWPCVGKPLKKNQWPMRRETKKSKLDNGMIEGLDFAIASLQRRMKKHKDLSKGDYKNASGNVKAHHLTFAGAYDEVIRSLKAKKAREIKKLQKQ